MALPPCTISSWPVSRPRRDRPGAFALEPMLVLRLRLSLSDATLKLPSRATLNEQKRENWLRDLADPAVPLARLARSVPHGFKGERMLEMLVQRQIPSDRAIWYLRAISIADVVRALHTYRTLRA